MAVVISLSSDSDSDSEVECVGFYSNKNVISALSSVRVEVGGLDVKTPSCIIDLTNPSTATVELDIFSRLVTPSPAVVDLTEDTKSCEDQETLLHLSSNYKSVESPGDPTTYFETEKVCVQRRVLTAQKTQLTTKLSCHRTTSVVLKRLPFLENNLNELLASHTVCVIKKAETMSLHLKQCDKNGPRPCTHLSNTTTPHDLQCSIETLQDKSYQAQVTEVHRKSPVAHFKQADHLHKDRLPPTLSQKTELSSVPSPACASASSKGQNGLSNQVRAYSPSLPVGTVKPAFCGPRNGSPACTFHSDVKTLPQTIPKYESLTMTETLRPQDDEKTSDKESVIYNPPSESAPSRPRTIYSDDASFTYEDNFGKDSPLSFSWEESIEDVTTDFELGLDLDCTSPTQEDKYYVCPAAVQRLMHGGCDGPTTGKNPPQMLCQRSLSLVYSTIQENYLEGTLQLLSDMLQPGYYPPKEVTLHLLEDILLNSQTPHHNCVQAFRLLMRTQRHCMVDKESVSWNWEMLSIVMDKKELPPENIRMFLDYVVQTLEDDFKTKQSSSEIYQSIAKAMLSFDHQFPHIRDICKWLFSAIEKSTDGRDIKGDHTRIVENLQKLLSLALEVDGSPAISSIKLSQELFLMLISNVPLRPQRMLLLESLQSKRLRCNLLQHLLDYSCPVKTSVPMSLNLLLHFLKNCTLSLDPIDGAEKWRRWEELVHHLWMFLLSYSNAMKGYLNSAKKEQKNNLGTWICKPDDMVSKCAVREAVEAFLSRSQDDIGEALPLHVEESLTYLQDHLMDVCQC